MTPSLVMFDFDGTLVDTQEIVNKLEWKLFLNHGMKMSLSDFTDRFSGETVLSIVEHLKEENNLRLSKKSSHLAKEIDEAVLAKLFKRRIIPIKGVKKLLKMLPIKKCIASNCSLMTLRTLLSASALALYFNENVFGADMVEKSKPYPDVFVLAAKSMGVKPSQCLVIEDSEAGVKAAVAAEMTAWGFLGASHIKPGMKRKLLNAGAERTFSNMNDLLPLISKKDDAEYAIQRAKMVQYQLKRRGIKDQNVLKAMRTVPRHLFVPNAVQKSAYTDSALPIGYEQTISQPYIVARMCELACLSPQSRVLEIGSGSGYEAAVLSLLSREVYTIEIIEPLGKTAKSNLKDSGYKNVHVKIADGYSGWPNHAPYDAILITAETDEIPQPLLDQLKLHGRLIMPLRTGFQQQLVRFTKTKSGLKKETFGQVLFVPFQRKENSPQRPSSRTPALKLNPDKA